MKVYYSYQKSKKNPMILIKNSKLKKYDFDVGTYYEIIYEPKKIILEVKDEHNK